MLLTSRHTTLQQRYAHYRPHGHHNIILTDTRATGGALFFPFSPIDQPLMAALPPPPVRAHQHDLAASFTRRQEQLSLHPHDSYYSPVPRLPIHLVARGGRGGGGGAAGPDTASPNQEYGAASLPMAAFSSGFGDRPMDRTLPPLLGIPQPGRVGQGLLPSIAAALPALAPVHPPMHRDDRHFQDPYPCDLVYHSHERLMQQQRQWQWQSPMHYPRPPVWSHDCLHLQQRHTPYHPHGQLQHGDAYWRPRHSDLTTITPHSMMIPRLDSSYHLDCAEHYQFHAHSYRSAEDDAAGLWSPPPPPPPAAAAVSRVSERSERSDRVRARAVVPSPPRASSVATHSPVATNPSGRRTASRKPAAERDRPQPRSAHPQRPPSPHLPPTQHRSFMVFTRRTYALMVEALYLMARSNAATSNPELTSSPSASSALAFVVPAAAAANGSSTQGSSSKYTVDADVYRIQELCNAASESTHERKRFRRLMASLSVLEGRATTDGSNMAWRSSTLLIVPHEDWRGIVEQAHQSNLEPGLHFTARRTLTEVRKMYETRRSRCGIPAAYIQSLVEQCSCKGSSSNDHGGNGVESPGSVGSVGGAEDDERGSVAGTR
ncbi:hypothetical protein BC828DRAFT_380575 [Blastocladiella britannica]|nr:hypothetical protein BC828DRAFT_380575 [Blastocladiella britannica]